MKRVMVAMAISMLLATGFVYAQGTGAGAGSAPEGKGEAKGTYAHGHWEHGKQWSFTPEQKAKIMEWHRSFMKDNAQLIGSLVTKKLEFKALWADPKADDKALMDKEKEVIALKAQLKEKAFEMKLACRKLLTPEQLTSGMGCRCMGHHSGMKGGHGMGQHKDMMGGHGMMGHHEM